MIVLTKRAGLICCLWFPIGINGNPVHLMNHIHYSFWWHSINFASCYSNAGDRLPIDWAPCSHNCHKWAFGMQWLLLMDCSHRCCLVRDDDTVLSVSSWLSASKPMYDKTSLIHRIQGTWSMAVVYRDWSNLLLCIVVHGALFSVLVYDVCSCHKVICMSGYYLGPGQRAWVWELVAGYWFVLPRGEFYSFDIVNDDSDWTVQLLVLICMRVAFWLLWCMHIHELSSSFRSLHHMQSLHNTLYCACSTHTVLYSCITQSFQCIGLISCIPHLLSGSRIHSRLQRSSDSSLVSCPPGLSIFILMALIAPGPCICPSALWPLQSLFIVYTTIWEVPALFTDECHQRHGHLLQPYTPSRCLDPFEKA